METPSTIIYTAERYMVDSLKHNVWGHQPPYHMLNTTTVPKKQLLPKMATKTTKSSVNANDDTDPTGLRTGGDVDMIEDARDGTNIPGPRPPSPKRDRSGDLKGSAPSSGKGSTTALTTPKSKSSSNTILVIDNTEISVPNADVTEIFQWIHDVKAVLFTIDGEVQDINLPSAPEFAPEVWENFELNYLRLMKNSAFPDKSRITRLLQVLEQELTILNNTELELLRFTDVIVNEIQELNGSNKALSLKVETLKQQVEEATTYHDAGNHQTAEGEEVPQGQALEAMKVAIPGYILQSERLKRRTEIRVSLGKTLDQLILSFRQNRVRPAQVIHMRMSGALQDLGMLPRTPATQYRPVPNLNVGGSPGPSQPTASPPAPYRNGPPPSYVNAARPRLHQSPAGHRAPPLPMDPVLGLPPDKASPTSLFQAMPANGSGRPRE